MEAEFEQKIERAHGKNINAKASCSSTLEITQLNGGSKCDIDSFQRQVIYTCSTSFLVG